MGRVIVLLCVALAALNAAERKSKTLAAHEHGTATISLAIEGGTAEIEFEASAEGVLGFEHKATTAADRKKAEAALTILRQRFGEMVLFDAAAACKIATRKVEVEQEQGENHSEIRAAYSVACAKPLSGTKVQFGVTKMFPRIRVVAVQVLNGAQHTGLAVKEDRGVVALAK